MSRVDDAGEERQRDHHRHQRAVAITGLRAQRPCGFLKDAHDRRPPAAARVESLASDTT
ncbi:MAG: hypothetical protein ABSB69_18905 [Solirubrobacteraceae bacterium]